MKKVVLAIFLASALARAEAGWPPAEALRLADRAERVHPALKSARLEAEAFHALAGHHRAWMPPEAGVEFFKAPVASFPNPLRRQEEIDWSVAQKIPFPGKNARMAAPEHWRGAAVEARAGAAAHDLRRRVVAAWAEAWVAEGMLKLLRAHHADATALRDDARAGYSGGGGSVASLHAQREMLRLESDLLRTEAMRREALAMLGALAGGDTVLAGVSQEAWILPAREAADGRPARVEARPDLEAARRERSMAEAELAAARAEWLPDFSVRVMYKDMRGLPVPEDSWSLMVGMEMPFLPLPPWSGGVRQAERRARALRARAERDVEAMTLMAEAEAESARAMLEASLARARLLNDSTVPLADRLLAAARAEYANGASGYAEVVDALRETRLAREELLRAEADALKAWADYEYATGGGVK